MPRLPKVTVADLRTIALPAGVLLYCTKCGATNSADPSDYFASDPGFVFRCCRRNMQLGLRGSRAKNDRGTEGYTFRFPSVGGAR